MKQAIQIMALVFAGIFGIFVLVKIGTAMFDSPPEDFKRSVINNCKEADRPEEPYGLCVERSLNALRNDEDLRSKN